MSRPKVGDVLTTVDQLDALPSETVIRANNGNVARKVDLYDDPWHVAGVAAPYPALDLFRCGPRWQVIWLPPVTRVEFCPDSWGIDGRHASFQHTPELLDLLRSALVGDRVRVTVEKIGADDV